MEFYKATDFLKVVFPQPKWTIPGLLPGSGITMLYAFPKVGKSILSMQLAHALTTGTDFLGRKPQKLWNVLYVQCDLIKAEWQSQVEYVGIPETWTTALAEPGWIKEPKEMTTLKRRIDEDKFDFIIYDSLVSMGHNLDLDNHTTMRHTLRQLMSLSENPCLLIHHKRKGMPGVPDHSSVSAAGAFTLAAGVSTLFDLRDKSLEVRGRIVRREIELKRGTNGIWLPKSEKDLYKI